jgi:hypothetical protein
MQILRISTLDMLENVQVKEKDYSFQSHHDVCVCICVCVCIDTVIPRVHFIIHVAAIQLS